MERALAKAILAAITAGILFLVFIVLAPVVLFTSVFAQGAQGSPTPTGPSSGPVPADLVAVFDQAGKTFDVNPYLLASVAEQESGFHTEPRNPSGCVGPMQIGVGGACGDTWDSTVKLTGGPVASVLVHDAYKLGMPPAGDANPTPPDINDWFQAVTAAAVILRGKVGGVPIPNLDGTAFQAAYGYYGHDSFGLNVYAPAVLGRAKLWQGENALSPAGPVSPGTYVNPLGQIAHLSPERVDEGVDYAGSGNLLALGDGTVLLSVRSGVGWPRCDPVQCTPQLPNDNLGGFVGYQLSDGPHKGKYVFVAENIDPLVSNHEKVTAGEPIATLHLGGAGLETGWWSGKGSGALALALGQEAPGNDPGAWTTALGASFNRELRSLGAPSGILQGTVVHGKLPSGYP